PGQVGNTTKAERARRMTSVGKMLTDEYTTQFVGKNLDVLYECETDKPGVYEGYSGNYIAVRTAANHDIRNVIISSKIVRADGGIAYAEPFVRQM
ncbi:MAG: hypothetical protein FWD96_05420, partial [Defluviitaleaceae bacterium]|nr:hypothetical protein [Defluviitaleaceae bacterium]